MSCLTHSFLANILEVAIAAPTKRKGKKPPTVEAEQEKWMLDHGLFEGKQDNETVLFFTESGRVDDSDQQFPTRSERESSSLRHSEGAGIGKESRGPERRGGERESYSWEASSSRTMYSDYVETGSYTSQRENDGHTSSMKQYSHSQASTSERREEGELKEDDDDDDDEDDDDDDVEQISHAHHSGVGLFLASLTGTDLGLKQPFGEKKRLERKRTHKDNEKEQRSYEKKKMKTSKDTELERKEQEKSSKKLKPDSKSSTDHSSRRSRITSYATEDSLDSIRCNYSRDSSTERSSDKHKRKSRDREQVKVYSSTTSRDSSIDDSKERGRRKSREKSRERIKVYSSTTSRDSSIDSSKEYSRTRSHWHHSRDDSIDSQASSDYSIERREESRERDKKHREKHKEKLSSKKKEKDSYLRGKEKEHSVKKHSTDKANAKKGKSKEDRNNEKTIGSPEEKKKIATDTSVSVVGDMGSGKATPTTTTAAETSSTVPTTTMTTPTTTPTTPTTSSSSISGIATNSPIPLAMPHPLQFISPAAPPTSRGTPPTLIPLMPPFPLPIIPPVSAPPTSNAPPMPLMVPVYLPPDYQQFLAASQQQSGVRGTEGLQQTENRSRSGTPVMDETPVAMVMPMPDPTPLTEHVGDEKSEERKETVTEGEGPEETVKDEGSPSKVIEGEEAFEEEALTTTDELVTSVETKAVAVQTDYMIIEAGEDVVKENKEEEEEDKYRGIKVDPSVDFKRLKAKALKV